MNEWHIKAESDKIVRELALSWPKALPLVLMGIGSTVTGPQRPPLRDLRPSYPMGPGT